jgi:hypothetical protein
MPTPTQPTANLPAEVRAQLHHIIIGYKLGALPEASQAIDKILAELAPFMSRPLSTQQAEAAARPGVSQEHLMLQFLIKGIRVSVDEPRRLVFEPVPYPDNKLDARQAITAAMHSHPTAAKPDKETP